MNILILGASGMLGSQVLHYINKKGDHNAYGTVRSETVQSRLELFGGSILTSVLAEDMSSIRGAVLKSRADVVINCIGVVKQLAESKNAIISISLNSLFPHLLKKLGTELGFRTIHVSTDCVFSGDLGGYKEGDLPDATDIYGKSKHLGEIDGDNCVTLRTSIIGHELAGSRSLIDWFLNEKQPITGFSKAIFSGLPTVELAKVIHDHVLPNTFLNGLFHVAAEPISKFELLNLVNEVYRSNKNIHFDDLFIINRSLNSDKFYNATGYSAPDWRKMIYKMKESAWWKND